jgi:hypothetical protein
LYRGVLGNTHQIAIWKRIGEPLRQFVRDISPEWKSAITSAGSQERSALPRLNPAQEPIPIRF